CSWLMVLRITSDVLLLSNIMLSFTSSGFWLKIYWRLTFTFLTGEFTQRSTMSMVSHRISRLWWSVKLKLNGTLMRFWIKEGLSTDCLAVVYTQPEPCTLEIRKETQASRFNLCKTDNSV